MQEHFCISFFCSGTTKRHIHYEDNRKASRKQAPTGLLLFLVLVSLWRSAIVTFLRVKIGEAIRYYEVTCSNGAIGLFSFLPKRTICLLQVAQQALKIVPYVASLPAPALPPCLLALAHTPLVSRLSSTNEAHPVPLQNGCPGMGRCQCLLPGWPKYFLLGVSILTQPHSRVSLG